MLKYSWIQKITYITVSTMVNSFVMVKYTKDLLPNQLRATTGDGALNSSCNPNAGQFIAPSSGAPSLSGKLALRNWRQLPHALANIGVTEFPPPDTRANLCY